MVIDKQACVERTEAIETEIGVAEETNEGIIFSYIHVRSSLIDWIDWDSHRKTDSDVTTHNSFGKRKKLRQSL